LRTKAAEYLRQAKALCPQDFDILAEEQQLRVAISSKMFTSTNSLFKSAHKHSSVEKISDLLNGVLNECN